ncbi:hypothetical protein PV327_005356 [Microctonus hyperodae]|uniref:Methyltransferase type 12 domain-containing protein n=1 Tax=Microctonus hyperodae TaxID=165561 RepID=A0AA39KZG1_MICHY|nr:hypothetical protein PV327_005356 [Microctonus hyperodae]
MEPHNYVGAHDLQRRDASDIVEEFADVFAAMHGTCIDIGCGPGTITNDIILTKLPKDANIIGADISNSMVEKARKIYKNEKRLKFFQLDIETDSLPISEMEKYDSAVSFYCLHWCQNMQNTLNNIHQLLRPGGHGLVMFISYHIGYEAYKRLQNNPRFKPYLEDTWKYIPSFQDCLNPRMTMKKMLEKTGFEVLHCSNHEKTYIYENIETLKNHMIAVNPFLDRMPDDIKNEYLNELTKQLTHDTILFKNKKDTSPGYNVLDRYKLLIAHFRKPDNSIIIER